MKISNETEILAESPLFCRVDRGQLKLMALMAESRTFHEGETLMVQGEEGDSAYVILEGEAEVLVRVGGHDTPVARLGPRDIVGEMALLTETPRSATVRACGTLRALRLDRASLMRCLQEFPCMALELLKVMTVRLERTTQELARTRAELEEMRAGG